MQNGMISLQGKSLNEIIGKSVIGVTPNTPVLDTIKLMRKEKISCVPVLEGGKPVGIFTERNIVGFAVGKKGKYKNDCEIKKLMSTPVITGGASINIFEAYNIFNSHHIRHLVVIDENGIAIGVVTQSDIIDNLGYENFIEVKDLSRIMSKNLFIVKPDTRMDVVVDNLMEREVGYALVAVDNKPFGIFTERDMVKLLVEERKLSDMKISDAMSPPVISISDDKTLLQAARIMRDNNTKNIVMVDEKGCIEGLITQTDILNELEVGYIEILKKVIRQQDQKLEAIAKDLTETTIYLENILRWSVDMGVIALNMDLNIVYFNPAAENLLGLHANAVIGKKIETIKRSDGCNLVEKANILQTSDRYTRFTDVFEHKDNQGVKIIQAQFSGIWDKNGKCFGYVIMLNDITKQKRFEQKLAHMATHDSLTGLPNRALFNDLIEMEIRRSKRSTKKFGVLFVDLDEFKEVNDTFGHAAGDALLISLGSRLKSVLRESDTIARLGGDEFLVLLPLLNEGREAENVALKIIKAIQQPFIIDSQKISTTASVGLSIFPDDGNQAEKLIKLADIAMYAAKKKGKNYFVRYSGN